MGPLGSGSPGGGSFTGGVGSGLPGGGSLIGLGGFPPGSLSGMSP